MNKSSGCENHCCEFVPSIDSRQLKFERSVDEVRYGILWAEVELPKLLVNKEQKMEGGKQT